MLKFYDLGHNLQTTNIGIGKCLFRTFKNDCKKEGLSLPGGVYDQPIHLQPVFDGNYKKGSFPKAEEVCERHICLPIYPNLSDEEVNQTIEILNKAI